MNRLSFIAQFKLEFLLPFTVYCLVKFLQPCITKNTRIVSYNIPGLVDNIFVNIYDKTIFSGNLLDKIVDHLPNSEK